MLINLLAFALLDELITTDREDIRLEAHGLDDEEREREEARADWLDERDSMERAATKFLGYGE